MSLMAMVVMRGRLASALVVVLLVCSTQVLALSKSDGQAALEPTAEHNTHHNQHTGPTSEAAPLPPKAPVEHNPHTHAEHPHPDAESAAAAKGYQPPPVSVVGAQTGTKIVSQPSAVQSLPKGRGQGAPEDMNTTHTKLPKPTTVQIGSHGRRIRAKKLLTVTDVTRRVTNKEGQTQWILRFHHDTPEKTQESKLHELKSDCQGKVHRALHKILPNAYVVTFDRHCAKKTADLGDVDFLEEDQVVSIEATSTAKRLNSLLRSTPGGQEKVDKQNWGLDRIDARRGLDGSYSYTDDGTGVHAYIVDSGIRTTHQEFGGRASVFWDYVHDGHKGQDCHGHGTHVASVVGGTKSGVAKNVQLHSVRVLDCQGKGTMSAIIAALEDVRKNVTKPAVVNLSLGGFYSSALNDAIQSLVDYGVGVVASAGNEHVDACTVSPASAPRALSVGATDFDDLLWSNSNYGECVDVWAPGVDISGASHLNDTSFSIMTGSSMAAPHATGAFAKLLGHRGGNFTAASAANELVRVASCGKIGGELPNSTANLVLFSPWTGPNAPDPDQCACDQCSPIPAERTPLPPPPPTATHVATAAPVPPSTPPALSTVMPVLTPASTHAPAAPHEPTSPPATPPPTLQIVAPPEPGPPPVEPVEGTAPPLMPTAPPQPTQASHNTILPVSHVSTQAPAGDSSPVEAQPKPRRIRPVMDPPLDGRSPCVSSDCSDFEHDSSVTMCGDQPCAKLVDDDTSPVVWVESAHDSQAFDSPVQTTDPDRDSDEDELDLVDTYQ